MRLRDEHNFIFCEGSIHYYFFFANIVYFQFVIFNFFENVIYLLIYLLFPFGKKLIFVRRNEHFYQNYSENYTVDFLVNIFIHAWWLCAEKILHERIEFVGHLSDAGSVYENYDGFFQSARVIEHGFYVGSAYIKSFC